MRVDKLKDKMVFMENTFTKRVIFSEDKALCFVLNLMPGQSIPPHNHEESDLILQVLTGSFEFSSDDKKYNAVQGDIIHCTGKELIGLNNNSSENMSCLVILAPSPEMKIYSKEV